MQRWDWNVVCPRFSPRQFELHPTFPDIVLFGSVQGEVVVADICTNSHTTVSEVEKNGGAQDHASNVIKYCDLSKTEGGSADPVLGLCWLRKHPHKFVVGSSDGTLRLCEMGKDVLQTVCAKRGRSHEREEAAASMPSKELRVTTSFAKFDELTSVHVNATDERLLVSGYTNSAQIFDMETASVVRYFENIHSNHINIARFTNHSPQLFGTSSFDKVPTTGMF
jgi:WD40 repeat protein